MLTLTLKFQNVLSATNGNLRITFPENILFISGFTGFSCKVDTITSPCTSTNQKSGNSVINILNFIYEKF